MMSTAPSIRSIAIPLQKQQHFILPPPHLLYQYVPTNTETKTTIDESQPRTEIPARITFQCQSGELLFGHVHTVMEGITLV